MERFWKKKTLVSFILALFIVAIHNNTVVLFSAMDSRPDLIFITEFFNNLFSLTITRVAVPLFFVLSGVCFFRDHEKGMYVKKIKSRIRTLFVPYLFWNGFLMAVIVLVSHTSCGKFLSFPDPILPTWKMMINGILFFRFNNAFWFVYALILLVMITPIINFLMREKWTGAISCALALMIPALFPKQFAAIFQGQFYSSIFFYFAGCFLGKYYFRFFSQKANQKKIILSGIVCSLFVILKLAELYDLIHIHEIIMNIVLLTAAIAFWFVCDCFTEKIKMKPFMNDSFMLYALHPFIGNVFTNLMVLCWGKNFALAIPLHILTYILTVVFSLALAGLLKHSVPRSYGVISGNRG